MRKMMILIMSCLLFSSAAYAETVLTDEDYKNLDELKTKLGRLRKEMDSFMKDVIAASPDEQNGEYQYFGQDVKVDISENEKNIIVRADMPGMDKDKIDITLERNRILRIAGSRDAMKKETAPGMVRQERTRGAFERALELPAECVSEGLKATYKDGVLEVILPKKPRAQDETVKIGIQ